MNDELLENEGGITQVSNVDAGKVDVFGTPVNLKRDKKLRKELGLMEDVNHVNISWNQNSYTKKKIKDFIRAELAKIGIDRYHQYDITRRDIEDKQASIQILAWDHDRQDPESYECTGYNKEELEGVIDTYIDSVKSHFEKLGIRVTNDRCTSTYKWRKTVYN